MKTAILSCFHPFRGGIAQFNASLAQELGRTHELRAFNFKRQYPSLLFPGKSQYVGERDEASPVQSTPVLDTANPLGWGRAAREIRTWDPDVLLMRYWMPYFAPSLGYVARHQNPRCKKVAILDNVVPHEQHFFDRPLTSRFLGSLDGAVVLCKEVGQDLLSFTGSLPHVVLHHPVYTHFGQRVSREEALKELGLEDSPKHTLMFFGLIREYKGLDILLKAFELLGSGYRLIVAGEPYGSFEPYRKLIDASSHKEDISLYPEFIPDSRVKYFFSAADLAVLPYRSATQSGISSVSCHFGVPMVVSDVGGLKETIADKKLGLVCGEATPENVADAVRQYFATPSLKEIFAEAMDRENKRLSWNGFCKGLTDFVESL